ncbi:hypothetical protein ABZX85_10030 [Streptomyces sp. NPDC004539]|uniref:hypothetical protein n=1 Tax=Streptomyces sp. NPDC004539 TaxID=3154280 RepID=UPI0033B67C80
MGRILKGVARVPWGSLMDAALDELGDRICSLGFVVSEATPHVVPFLVELAGDGSVRCRADVLELIRKIYSARAWESAGSSSSPKSLDERVAWEAARRLVVVLG